MHVELKVHACNVWVCVRVCVCVRVRVYEILGFILESREAARIRIP